MNDQTLTPDALWADIEAVRSQSPLVHSITNWVVMNFNANVLLAAGASPVMAHAHEEVQDMVAIAQSLVLNIGTLEPYWIDSMALALRAANAKGIPVVLDPVGAGATPYRNAALNTLLSAGRVQVIRGNGSEIMSTAHTAIQTRGVDSSARSEDALSAGHSLAQRTGATVCLSGETDFVVDAQGRQAALSNGHAWMTRITGVGCSLTALVGAVCAVQPDTWRATAAAVAWMGVAGEVATEKTQAAGRGVGSLATALLDELQLMPRSVFLERLRLQVAA